MTNASHGWAENAEKSITTTNHTKGHEKGKENAVGE